MAYVGGPSSYLPGQKVFLPLGVCCDEHTEVKAVARIVGEADSFGYEAIDMCQECYTNFQNQDKIIEGICDWCGSSDKNLKHKRDPDEGTSGRIYSVCSGCISARAKKDIIDSDDDENDSDGSPYIDHDDFDPDESDRDN